jgi:cell division septal protein FtsQ
MWFFRRNPANRRNERRHVLDVKLRADVARAQYVRRAAALFLSIFGTLLALLVFWRAGEWLLDFMLFRNDAYVLRRIEIQTDGALASDQIRRWAGVAAGQNLLALDLAHIKRDLELVPAIRSATLERVLPNTLRLRVVEREPVAEVQAVRTLPSGTVSLATFHLDEEGCVLPPLDPRQRAAARAQPEPGYPLISGLDSGELAPGRRLTAPPVRAALGLITAFDESPMVGLDELRRIDLTSEDILQVTTALGAQVTFSARDLERQLRRWREIYDYGQRTQRHLAWLDLAVSNNVPARWLEASAQPPTPPSFLNHPRPRRRHV